MWDYTVEQNYLNSRSLSNVEISGEFIKVTENNLTPTEILTEFLSSIMLKDYEKSLKYCNEILFYEPDNSTAKEFQPLILKKLEMIKNKEIEDLLYESSDSYSSAFSSSDNSSVDFPTKSKILPSEKSESSSFEDLGDEFMAANIITRDLNVKNKEKETKMAPNVLPEQETLVKTVLKEKKEILMNPALTSNVLLYSTPTRTLKFSNSAVKNKNPPPIFKKEKPKELGFPPKEPPLLYASPTRTLRKRSIPQPKCRQIFNNLTPNPVKHSSV